MEGFYMKVASLNEELKKEEEVIKNITDSVYYQRKQVSIDFGEELDEIMMEVVSIVQNWLENFAREHLKLDVLDSGLKQIIAEKASELGSLSYHIGNVLEVTDESLTTDKKYMSEIYSMIGKVQSILEEFVK